MVRLIDANEPLRKIQKEIEKVQVWRDEKANRKDVVLFIHEIYKLDNWLGVYAECADLIDEAPTVDAVEVVHGKWVDRYGGKYANPAYDCSVCKKSALFRNDMDLLGNWKSAQYLSDFCPNCGAKMDGERKDNE